MTSSRSIGELASDWLDSEAISVAMRRYIQRANDVSRKRKALSPADPSGYAKLSNDMSYAIGMAQILNILLEHWLEENGCPRDGSIHEEVFSAALRLMNTPTGKGNA